jgi:hypothetical protein
LEGGGKAVAGLFRYNLHLAGQNLLCLLAHHDAAFFGREAGNHADIFLRSARLVPGQPYAVGIAQFRLAVMRGELVFGKHVFAIGLGVVRIAVGFIENINGQRAIDFYGFRFFPGIK